jgi:hypothetical protein
LKNYDDDDEEEEEEEEAAMDISRAWDNIRI